MFIRIDTDNFTSRSLLGRAVPLPEPLYPARPCVGILVLRPLVDDGIIGLVIERQELLGMLINKFDDELPVVLRSAGIVQHPLDVILIAADRVGAGHPLKKVSFGEGPALGVHARSHAHPALGVAGAALALGGKELVLGDHSVTFVLAMTVPAAVAFIATEDVIKSIFIAGDDDRHIHRIADREVVEDAVL